MAIAFDAASNAQYTAGSGGTLTWSHTCTGTNLVLWVSATISTGGNSTITGITYNGVAMTEVSGSPINSTSIETSGWILIAPATGTHNIVATINAFDNNFSCVAASYTGVHQTTATGTPATATGAVSTITVDVSSASGEVVVDGVGVNDPTWAWTAGAGQTARTSYADPAGFDSSALSEEAGATTVTMSWTGTPALWATIGVSLKPASASSHFVVF